MASQHIDFKDPVNSAVTDNGEREPSSIRPIQPGEWATETVTRRPAENLRKRTEILRTAVENLNYLADTASSMTVTGGGQVTWHGLAVGAAQGTFVLDEDLIVKPMFAPFQCLPATALLDGVRLRTYTSQPGGSAVPVPRAYSGANRITVEITVLAGATLEATVDGSPQDNLHLVVSTTTTIQQVIDFINANTAFRSVGVAAELVSGAVATDVWGVASTTLQLAGAVDAEQHVITPTGLAAFFSTTTNRLQEGDTIGISYAELVMEGSYGGRRQSIAEAPEQSENCDSNIFNLRVNPEKGPQAVPIASVVNGNLVFVTGITLNTGQTSPLTFNNSGTDITYTGSGNWADGTNVGAGSVSTAITEIVADLAAFDGAERIGAREINDGFVIIAEGSVQNALDGIAAHVDKHVDDATAHSASAIHFEPVAGIDNSNVQAAIEEVFIDAMTEISAHIGNATDAHDASAISVTPVTGAAGDDVQEILGNIQKNVDNHVTDTSGAHAASAISFSPTGNVSATDVQLAIQQVGDALDGKARTGGINTFTGLQTFTVGIKTSAVQISPVKDAYLVFTAADLVKKATGGWTFQSVDGSSAPIELARLSQATAYENLINIPLDVPPNSRVMQLDFWVFYSGGTTGTLKFQVLETQFDGITLNTMVPMTGEKSITIPAGPATQARTVTFDALSSLLNTSGTSKAYLRMKHTGDSASIYWEFSVLRVRYDYSELSPSP